jgi:methionyl-tRNA formyltransferase
MSVNDVDRLVRGTTNPYPGAYVLRDDKKIIIWSGILSEVKIECSVYYEIVLVDGFYYATNYEVVVK